jgi:hypothetical protein
LLNILLDRVLAHYGPETKEARDFLRGAVARTLDLLRHQDHQQHSEMQPTLVGDDMIKFGRYPRRTIFNTQSRPRPRAWLLISENCAG